MPFIGWESVAFQGELSMWLGKGLVPMMHLWSLFRSGPHPVGAVVITYENLGGAVCLGADL